MADFLIRLFASVLDMSLGAALTVLAVIGIRFLLKSTPRRFSYFLWIAVLLRLLIPYHPEASFGLIPSFQIRENVSEWMLSGALADHVQSFGMEPEGKAKEGLNLETGEDGGNPASYQNLENTAERNSESRAKGDVITAEGMADRRGFWTAAAFLWLTGCLCLFLYEAVSYGLFLKRLGKVRTKGELTDAANGRFSIFISKEVETPFTAGFVHPVIYLPEKLSREQQSLVLEHEGAHLRRRDHWLKPAVFILLCVHWFNPLLWLAFRLMEKDMEISCDESVLERIGHHRKKDYAQTLLGLSGGNALGAVPIAFGESSVEERIKNVMKFKKAKLGAVIIAGIVVCSAVLLLLINRTEPAEQEPIQIGAEEQTEPGDQIQAEKQTESDDQIQAEEMAELEKQMIDLDKVLKTEQQAEAERQAEIEKQKQIKYEKYIEEIQEKLLEQDAFDSHAVLLCENPNEIHEPVELLYADPVAYTRISDGYGIRIHPVSGVEKVHSGIDFAAEEGTPVWAAADGVVYETGFNASCGNYVILSHSNGDMTYYTSLEKIHVEKEQSVAVGEQIGTVGKTGKSTGAHLHFAVSRDGQYIEPVGQSDDW